MFFCSDILYSLKVCCVLNDIFLSMFDMVPVVNLSCVDCCSTCWISCRMMVKKLSLTRLVYAKAQAWVYVSVGAWHLSASLVCSILFLFYPLPSNRHHRSNGDCLEGKKENYQICSVQYCAQLLCTVQCTHIWTDLTVLWIGFCLTGPISLCLDSVLYMY